MISISLNQTESEKRLHRILYYVKVLRALCLNFVLIFLAFTLYIAFGITGLHPMAEDLINSLRSEQDHTQRYANTLAMFVVFLLGIAFLVWLYMSITRVLRKSLKAQSLFWVVCIPLLYYGVVPQFRFSYNHLDRLFTILFGMSWAFTLWWGADIATGLWRVSTSPEIYSFAAIQGPRLTKGIWARFNKLLDLPRTPLRTWRNGAAYLLSFGSYILLIVCLVYFTTFVLVSSKLGQLYSECDPKGWKYQMINMEHCATQSSAWAKQIGLWLIPAFIGIRVAILVQESARKLSSLSVGKALGDSKQRYILYLRSFTADETILPKPRLPLLSKALSVRPFPLHLEEEVFDVTDGYLPLIAIGRPGASQELTGGLAYREYLKDENWQTYVREKILAADSIVLLINSTEGVVWELENVISHSASAKTLFLIDPRAKDKELWQNLTKLIIPIFARAGVLAPDFHFAGHLIGFYFSRDGLVEIENTNWSATSYRTAFSHYLSERARP
jgi:hypothetical protein